LDEMINSKDENKRAEGRQLRNDYNRLHASAAIFEVTKDDYSGSSEGMISYLGNQHFAISLTGNTRFGLTNNQKLAHEFEHGRQILDGELSFYLKGKKWRPWVQDRTDEAKAFEAAFSIERASPAQGKFNNELQTMFDLGGIDAAVDYLGRKGSYTNLPGGPLDAPNIPSPKYYHPPQ
jgi:hypothetical protein